MLSELCTPSVKCFDNNFFKKIGAVVSLVQGTDSNSTHKEQVTVDRTDAHAGKGRDRAVYVQVPEDVRSG